uniref:Polycystic kidney disease 1b n=1 Tax=Labrus bergylta TaxID=56723 RepID=A0A3Q3KVW2_9LABR
HLGSQRCYWLSETSSSWSGGQDSCKGSGGGDLASTSKILVYPDDIVAIQHTRDFGTFLHCLNSDASLKSPWRQSYMSLRGTEWGGWWEGALTSLPKEGQWFGPGKMVLLQIHVQINVPTLIVVKVLSGENAMCSWSAPIQQTGIPFLPYCPEEVTQFLPDCKRQSHDAWFSSVILVIPTEGVQMLNISVVNAVSSQNLSVEVCGYTAVTGLSVEPHRCRRMLVGIPQSFMARVKSGSSVIFTWVIDNLDNYAHEGKSYSIVFKKPAEYKLKVRYCISLYNVEFASLLLFNSFFFLIEFNFLSCFFYEDDFTLHVKVFNQYNTVDAFTKISVQPKLHHLDISSTPAVPLVKQTLLLEAFPEPFTHAVLYTWDFGDGSEEFLGTNRKVSHTFASAGVYNITVCVEVMENISGLTVSNNGPSELSSPTYFRATVATGTSLMWKFDFGDGTLQGNIRDGSIAHIYKSPGHYTVIATVSNSVSQAHQSISVEVYKLAVSGVLPTDCVMSGKEIQLSALVNGNISILTFHWLLGDGSPLAVVKGQSTALHRFQSPGSFNIDLTVFSSFASVSLNTSICVELGIINMTVQSSCKVGAVAEEVCFQVSVSPDQMEGYLFRWLRSPSNFSAMTKNSEQCLIFMYEGVEEISVTASNRVSNKTAKTSVTIQNPVRNLSVAHDSQIDAMTVNKSAFFWVVSCTGSNVSVLWDFGDGSKVEQGQNVSHVFTSKGQFTVTATAFNAVSRHSVTLKVNVLLPVSDLLLNTDQPYAAVGEETLISAFSSANSSTNYYWTVDDVTSTKQGTYQFQFTFRKPGVYQVRVIAQNLVSRREATILIEVFERIEGLQIKCQSLSNMKYVPTEEELLFNSSVTKGSNVTYHWLASGVNRQIAASGNWFQMITETPGQILVQLRASNMLGEVTSIVSLEAVQRITVANISKQSNIFALGKLVNMSVSVVSGSHLQYFWYVKSDILPLRTCVPFLLHTFASLGHCLVKVSVQNALGYRNVTLEFTIQEEVQEVDFEIEGQKLPFYIPTGVAVKLHGLNQGGSDLNWIWNVYSKKMPFSAANQTFINTFLHAGIYQVSLNVSNGINWQKVSHIVKVLDAITGLMLNTSKSSVCTEEQVTFTPAISRGSNVSFAIAIINKDWSHSLEMVEGQFTTSSLPAGTNLLKVKAWNQVSCSEMSASILVTEQIQDLRLVNCCSADLEAFKEIQFKAEVQSGPPVNYTWVFYLMGSEPTWLIGQEVIFTPQDSGSLSFSVFATSGVCSKTLNYTLTVHLPLKHVNIVCDSERIFVGHSVKFSATVNGGSNLSYLWNFGDSSETMQTDDSTLQHTYYIPGKYSIVVKVLNSVGHVSTKLHMEVEELQCTSPQVSFVQYQSTILRSRLNIFEVRVDNNCSVYKTTYLWEIFRESDCTNGNLELYGNKVVLKSKVDRTSPFLLVPKLSLDVGQYCLLFKVSLQETPLVVQQRTTVKVVHAPLVAVIKGGSHRLWPSTSDLVLDGSGTKDPDEEPGVEDTLQYNWTMMTLNHSKYHLVEQPLTRSNSSKITVFSTQLQQGTIYAFTLTVHKAGRQHGRVNQTFSNTILCSYLCRYTQLNPENCIFHQFVFSQYKWSAKDQTGMNLDLNEVSTSTGSQSANLVIRSGVLQPRQSYTFSLNVSQSGRVHPQSDIRLLDTLVTYNCSGWRDEESEASQLIYTFQVAPCESTGPACPLLTLYRGTRSTYGTLVPMGIPSPVKSRPVIIVTVQVEDFLGAKVIALNRVLSVENPAGDKVASQWLTNKRRTELWALVQHGNPQEIIPYSIALTSQLNQTARELKVRREIRENVTQALASLPVSSLMDVDQISSALSLSTVCNPLPLNILSNTLAAVSFSSHQNYSSTLQPASAIFLSALGHAGALMHSLMLARVPGEAPLSLSSSYVNTVGFHGDPSDLLDKSKGSYCHFHIPTSFTTHLKNQESEVVQLLFGMDVDTESNSFLTAADPPISTTLVAMELTTPQGQPIPIQDLDPDQAIWVTLPNKFPLGQNDLGGDGGISESGNGTCLTVTLPTEGKLNFTVNAVDGLDENVGLYISFNFSHDSGIVNPLDFFNLDFALRTNTSLDLSVRKLSLTLSASTTSTEETIFLSPLTNKPLFVNLTSSMGDGCPVHVSVCVFSSLCQYYSVKERRWSSEGLQSLEGSTLHAAHCLTKHLTLFGASMFVHPGAVVLLPPPSGPTRNMVVGIVCAVLVLIHVLVGLIAHKLDHLDSLRVSQVPLCGRPGLYHYRVLVKTGWRRGAGTTAHVGICLYGVTKSGSRHLQREGAFQRGGLDQFHLETDDNLGEIWKIRIWHDNTGLDPSWYVQHVVVWDPQTDHMFFFLLEDWLSVENQKNSTVEKEVLASCKLNLLLFHLQFMFGMVEHHLWLSLWECPAHSRLTRCQRVTCSALTLHLYMAMGALWYVAVGTEGGSGPVSAQLPVNMEAIAVGMTVALLVFPLQCCLCFLFGKCHNEVTSNCICCPIASTLGVARGKPSWLLPRWVLCVIYPVVAVLLGACITVVGVYGSHMSRTVVLMWLVSVLSAFLNSALLLEPLKVCVRALINTALWRPVDPEVEDKLAQESTVVRAFREHGGKVRPPCGYGLLQAKEEARKSKSKPKNYINFHSAALLEQRYSQCAAVLLTLLVLKVNDSSCYLISQQFVPQRSTVFEFLISIAVFFKLLGTLRFVRRWMLLGKVLQRAWRKLLALSVLLFLLLLLCTHLGNTVYSNDHNFANELALFTELCYWNTATKVKQKLPRSPTIRFFLSFRRERAELYRPTTEPQDYEMVEFFIKRLKLWMGLIKAKEFRHRVKFEGMDLPPSRSSQESCPSPVSPSYSCHHSPSISSSFSSHRALSSALSVRSEDSSVSESGIDIQPYLDRLLPGVSSLLFRFDQVNQITEDIHDLEIKLEEAQTRRRKSTVHPHQSTPTGCVLSLQHGEHSQTAGVRRQRNFRGHFTDSLATARDNTMFVV